MFVFQIERSTLDITLWDVFEQKNNVFLGEVLLDLTAAPLNDTSEW